MSTELSQIARDQSRPEANERNSALESSLMPRPEGRRDFFYHALSQIPHLWISVQVCPVTQDSLFATLVHDSIEGTSTTYLLPDQRVSSLARNRHEELGKAGSTVDWKTSPQIE